jgi:uncharacterized protein YjbI with pentapeptide repeats
MGEHPIYKEVKPVLLKSVRIIGKDLLRNLVLKYAMTQKGLDELEKSLLPKMDLLDAVDRDTIYFDGIKKIEEEMQNIIQKYPQSRVVVFIDDVDRCSPNTVLEVFESTKVFLGIEGFIYIIGLSYETIAKLFTAEYDKSGIKGDQYIRKIIQIPIMIPDWNFTDVRTLIENISHKLDKKYSDIVSRNIDLIATGVELNPREVKRFINNFILSYEIYSINPAIKPNELLAVQTLKVRWNSFYRIISSDNEFRALLEKYTKMTATERIRSLKDRNSDKANPPGDYEKILFELDSELWRFLSRQTDTVFEIRDWEIYRRAAELIKDIPTAVVEPTISRPTWVPTAPARHYNENLVKLLTHGEFAEFYRQIGDRGLELSGADLHDAKLSGVDLHGLKLIGGNFDGTELNDANLTEANLDSATFIKASLFKTKLRNASLRYANFMNANCREAIMTNADCYCAKMMGADLRGADLIGTSLYHADLRGADLKGAELGAESGGAFLRGTDLTGAINLPITREEAKSREAIL